jgi:hypothetical protein
MDNSSEVSMYFDDFSLIFRVNTSLFKKHPIRPTFLTEIRNLLYF